VRERLCTGWADKSEGASDASDDRVSALPYLFCKWNALLKWKCRMLFLHIFAQNSKTEYVWNFGCVMGMAGPT
jgi:hypothetical protein